MKRLFLILYLCLFGTLSGYAQHVLKARIVDHDSGEPLPGATAQLKGSTQGSVSDADGLVVVENIPAGRQTLVFSFVGYASKEQILQFPLANAAEPLLIELEEEEELEAVVIGATRSSRTIEDIPTRVEAISGEELGEKAVMNSTNISMLLRESTGIQIQQTSANSANQSIRIQGLDGRYTQLLRDGFPLYSGFASGLSIMQIPPLDLQQVEVIKGSASTLYGGGAIAGLINLVTKRPQEDPELSLMLNQTSALGTTLNAFWAARNEGWGSTVYASGHTQKPYDPNDDGFSDIPKVRSFTINPRLFRYFNEETSLWVGINASLEERVGGYIEDIDRNSGLIQNFTEANHSKRISSQLAFEKHLTETRQLNFKNSISYFNRDLLLPDYRFSGIQWGSFSEASYAFGSENSQWITGLNLFTDQFSESGSDNEERDYRHVTSGAFVQHTWPFHEQASLESGLRLDHNTEYGTFVLPRLSFLYRFSPKLTTRLGGGLGYKLPTPFTEETEALAYRNVQPIQAASLEAERSYGGNFDINYKTGIGEEVTLSVNQLFFYTLLEDALVLSPNGNSFVFQNADGPVRSQGSETNARLAWRDFKLFLQYAFTDVELKYGGEDRHKPLTPRHSAGAVLMFEQHGKWRIGYEAYYKGPQYLSDGLTRTREYWIMGLMAMREMEKFSLFLNFENFLDARQSRWDDIVAPPYTSPTFSEIWAPTDGFVINGGFIWKIMGGDEH